MSAVDNKGLVEVLQNDLKAATKAVIDCLDFTEDSALSNEEGHDELPPGLSQALCGLTNAFNSLTEARQSAAPSSGEGVVAVPPWREWCSSDHPPYDGEWFVARCDYAVRVVHYDHKHDRLPIDHTGWTWPSVPTHWMLLRDFSGVALAAAPSSPAPAVRKMPVEGCYCKDTCGAPRIMGRQMPCLRNPAYPLSTPLPLAGEEG